MAEISIKIDTDKPKDLEVAQNILDIVGDTENASEFEEDTKQDDMPSTKIIGEDEEEIIEEEDTDDD